MSRFIERVIGSAKLDVRIYEEVEADQTATGQAMVVVVASSLAAGVGALRESGLVGLVGGTVFALVSWFVWAAITSFLGTRLLPEPQTRSDVGELLRTVGFSSAPGVLRVFGAVPVVGRLITYATWAWMLVAMVVAVRQALDYRSTLRAVGVCLIGFVVFVAASFGAAVAMVALGAIGSRIL
jgi:hypothetical protein